MKLRQEPLSSKVRHFFPNLPQLLTNSLQITTNISPPCLVSYRKIPPNWVGHGLVGILLHA